MSDDLDAQEHNVDEVPDPARAAGQRTYGIMMSLHNELAARIERLENAVFDREI